VKTVAKLSRKRYVPRTSVSGKSLQDSKRSAQSPRDFYTSVTERKDVRVILEKLAKA